MSKQIAIIGQRGCGKTTFLAVWMSRMSHITNSNVIFKITSGKGHIDNAFAELNQGNWNAGTAAGTKFPVESALIYEDEKYPISVSDFAGGDLVSIFKDGGWQNPDGLTTHFRNILAEIRQSDTVVIILNLKDFRGESDYAKRCENEAVLVGMVDMYAANAIQQDIAIAFTAWDQYEKDIEKNFSNFHKYIEKELPALHNAIRLGSKAGDRIEYFAIAPVYETVPKTDPATGKVEPVPKKNFKSYGIVGSGSISNWIIKSVTTRKMWMSWKKVRPKVVQRKNEFAYSGAIFLAIFGAIIGLVYFSNHGWTRYTTAYWGQNWQSGAELLKQNYWFLLGWFFAAIFGSIYIAISSLIFAIIGFLGGTAVGAVWGFTEGGGLLMVPEYGLRLITISAIYLAKGTIYGIKQLCALTAKNFVIVYKQVRVFFANNI